MIVNSLYSAAIQRKSNSVKTILPEILCYLHWILYRHADLFRNVDDLVRYARHVTVFRQETVYFKLRENFFFMSHAVRMHRMTTGSNATSIRLLAQCSHGFEPCSGQKRISAIFFCVVRVQVHVSSKHLNILLAPEFSFNQNRP